MTSLIWLALALGFIFIEFFIGDLSMLMLGGGALAAAGVSLTSAPLWVGVVVFAVVSMSLLLLLRPQLKRRMSSMDNTIESHPSILAGKNALVEENVTDSSGLIRLAGDLWTARSLSGTTFQPGEKVVVVQISGNTAYVERALS